MAAQLRLKYARSLEVLATLEAQQLTNEVEAERALADKTEALAAAEAALAKEKASVAALQAQLKSTLVGGEAVVRANAAEARAAALEEELSSARADSARRCARAEELELKLTARDEAFDAAAAKASKELEALAQKLAVAELSAAESDAAAKEASTRAERAAARASHAASADSALAEKLAACQKELESEREARATAEAARAAAGEKLALTASALRLKVTALDELAATHAQCDETISGLSRNIAEARASHGHERSLLLARIAKLEQELADAATQLAPSDGSMFKRYVALKHENKSLEQQLAKHQAAASTSSASNSVAKKHAVQASLDAAQNALVSATHSTTQRVGNTSREKVSSGHDQVNAPNPASRRGSTCQGNTSSSSVNAGNESHDHNDNGSSNSSANRSPRGGDIWPTTITNGDAEPIYTYEPLKKQPPRELSGGSLKSDAAFQVFAPSANNSGGPSPLPQQPQGQQQQQYRELKAAVHRRPSPVPTAMPGLGSQHLQPDLPSAPPEAVVKLSSATTDAPPLPRTRRDSSFKPRSSGNSNSSPRAAAPREAERSSSNSSGGSQASKGNGSGRNGAVRAPSGMGLGPRALF